MSLKKFLILSGLIFSITAIPIFETYAQSQQGKAKTTQSKKKQVKAKKSRSMLINLVAIRDKEQIIIPALTFM